MTAIPERQKRRTWLMAAVAGVAAVLAVALVAVGAVALTNYEGGKDVGSDLPVVTFPDTPVAVLATVDEDDVLTSLTAFVLDADGMGGSMVSVPVTSDVTGGFGDERESLRQVHESSGIDGLRLATESTLNLGVDQFEVLDAGQLTSLFQPLGAIAVDLPVDVLDDRPDEVLFEAGPQDLGPAEMAALLTAHTPEILDREQRPAVLALWEAVSAAAGDGIAAPAEAATVSVTALAQHVWAGPSAARGLPAAAYAEDANPDGLDVEQLDLPETIMVFAAIAPSAMSTPRDGLINRIVGPPGSEAKVKETIQLLLFFNQNVVSVGFDGPDQEPTDIVTYEERNQSDAELSSPLFGTVRFPEPTERIVGVDVVITLGSAFIENDGPGFTPTSTTAETTP